MSSMPAKWKGTGWLRRQQQKRARGEDYAKWFPAQFCHITRWSSAQGSKASLVVQQHLCCQFALARLCKQAYLGATHAAKNPASAKPIACLVSLVKMLLRAQQVLVSWRHSSPVSLAQMPLRAASTRTRPGESPAAQQQQQELQSRARQLVLASRLHGRPGMRTAAKLPGLPGPFLSLGPRRDAGPYCNAAGRRLGMARHLHCLDAK